MNTEEFYNIYKKSSKVEIDSRKIEKNDIFFAFSGENFDAATLAEDAINKGAIAVIVENKKFENPDKNIFYTSSTLKFLQDLAVFHRSQIQIPIIGLTGSNGKTTTKELIHAVLQEKYKVQYTYGNLNNHIGVPLTLLSIKPEDEIAVVEMGANHQKEIEFLCSLAQPDFGYITNFGKAHLEGFGGVEGVIKGKSELYQYLISHQKTILVNDNDEIQLKKTISYSKKISFGKPFSNYYFEAFSENNFVGLDYKGQKIQSHLTGDYNFNNLSAAVSLGLHFGVNFSSIKKGIENYSPTNMRSQVIHKNGKTLVLDTYNANPSSMTESLKNFNQFKGTKTIIIGDMFELGEESPKEHSLILDLTKELNFQQIITVGKRFQEINHSSLAFPDVEELKNFLIKHPINTENILLKASRGIALERVLDFLV